MYGDIGRFGRYEAPRSRGYTSPPTAPVGGEKRMTTAPVTSADADEGWAGEVGGQLTMGIIGCLPDNVQQAIKSFSIRKGKQHVTFAFPFMEDLVRRFGECRSLHRSAEEPIAKRFDEERVGRQSCHQGFQNITPAMFFDMCPEIIYGFETLVTLIPSVNRSNHLIGLLTVNQKEACEGFRRHIESLFRILVMGKSVCELNYLPLLAMDLKGRLLQEAVDAGANTILEVHGEEFSRLYPGKSNPHLLHIIKENIVRHMIVSYQELLQLNIHEVESRLGHETDVPSSELDEGRLTTDSSYFHTLMELLQSISCSPSDFRRIHLFFMNPNMEAAVQEFWRLWSHEQVAAKVFPASSNKTKIGLHQYQLGHRDSCLSQPTHVPGFAEKISPNITEQRQPEYFGNVMTRVPVKEGLASVIKCLKNQDTSIIPLEGRKISSALLLKEDNKTENSKAIKGCYYVKNDNEKLSPKRAVMGLDAASIGISQYNLNTLGSDSAFHPPVTSFSNQQPLEFSHSFNVIKPTTSYPSSQRYLNKSFSEGMSSVGGINDTLESIHRDMNLIQTGVTSVPLLLGCYSSMKPYSPLGEMSRPVISMHGAPFFCCHWKPFAYGIDQI